MVLKGDRRGQQVLEYILLMTCILAFIVAVLGPFREYVLGLLERVLDLGGSGG